MAVRPDGRANPRQLIINQENKAGIAQLRQTLLDACLLYTSRCV